MQHKIGRVNRRIADLCDPAFILIFFLMEGALP